MKISMKISLTALIGMMLIGCSSSTLKYEKEDLLQTNNEFADVVKIQPVLEPTPLPEGPQTVVGKKAPSKKISKLKKQKVKSAPAAAPLAPRVRQPDIEDAEGFLPAQRRPVVDPFHINEVVTHNVTYFGIAAGEVKFKVEDFQNVNGRKAYTFATDLRTANLFASIYTVNDRVVTLVDFEDLTPRVFTLHVKESGQLREARSYFDTDKLRATYWEKKVTKKSGEEQKKQEWEILPFSQNVYSAIFYMRFFKWETGKEYSFRVADDEQNLVFKGTAIRREQITTDAGTFKAVVVKPTITLKGAFKPIGDIFIWLSDDEHKYVLRIESKIKIGTLVSEVTRIQAGDPH